MTSQSDDIASGERKGRTHRLQPISSVSGEGEECKDNSGQMPSIAPSNHYSLPTINSSERSAPGAGPEENNYHHSYYNSTPNGSSFLQPVHPAYPSNANSGDGILFQKVNSGYYPNSGNVPSVQPLPPYIGADGRPVTPFILNDDTIIEFEEESQEEYFRKRKQRAVTHCILFAIAILIGVLILFLSRGLTASMTSAAITRRMGAAGALGGMSTHG